MSQLNRRSVVKGAAWATPAVAVAAAAPAIAASCVPVSAMKATAIQWSSTQPSYIQGDTETHYVDYVFTNTASEPLPAGAIFTIQVTYDVLEGVESATSAAVTTGEIGTTVQQIGPIDNGDGTSHYTYDIAITTTAAIASGDGFALTVTAVYGALAGPVGEQVTVDSPMVSTDAATCTTTTTTIDLSGSSDGTSYTSPA